MTTIGPSEDDHADFDVSVETAPGSSVVEAEADEEEQRKRDAAGASTYDQALAHDGKTDEELIEERQDAARLVSDAVIVVGVVAAIAASRDEDEPSEAIVEEAQAGSQLETGGADEEDNDVGE